MFKVCVAGIATFLKPGATISTTTDFAFLGGAALRTCGTGTGIRRWNGRLRIGSYDWCVHVGETRRSRGQPSQILILLTSTGLDAFIPVVFKVCVCWIATFLKPGATISTTTDFAFLGGAALRTFATGFHFDHKSHSPKNPHIYVRIS